MVMQVPHKNAHVAGGNVSHINISEADVLRYNLVKLLILPFLQFVNPVISNPNPNEKL